MLTGLDLLDVPPSVEKCKAEIRKKGAKLELNQKTTATKKARMTYQDHQDYQDWSYPDTHYESYQDYSFEAENLKIIAAAIAARNKQKI